MIKKTYTLSIKDYMLFEETKNVKYLMKIRYKWLAIFYIKGLKRLESDLLERFGSNSNDRVDDDLTLKLYYYHQMLHFRMMYLVLKNSKRQEMLDAYKLAFRRDYKGDLNPIHRKMEFYNSKYKELISKIKTKKQGYTPTLNDEISTIEAILSITIDRNLPISIITSYRERVSEKMKQING